LPHAQSLPDTYRLLSVFSGIPLKSVAALKLAGLWAQDDSAPISDHLHALLRRLSDDGRIRWVAWGPDGEGYVLTGYGAAALDNYHQTYGPALAEVLERRLLAAFTGAAQTLRAALETAGLRSPGLLTPICQTHQNRLVRLAARGHVSPAGDGYVRTDLGTTALEAAPRERAPA